MSHSNQIREYILTNTGIHLIEPYIGAAGVLTGSARLAQEARDRAATVLRRQEVERRARAFEAKRTATERQIAELRAAIEAEAAEVRFLVEESKEHDQAAERDRSAMSARRGGSGE